jgi:hypothetical protein
MDFGYRSKAVPLPSPATLPGRRQPPEASGEGAAQDTGAVNAAGNIE